MIASGVKVLCTAVMLMTLAFAQYDGRTIDEQLSQRATQNATNIEAIKQRLDKMDEARIPERLARIEQRQEISQEILIAIAVAIAGMSVETLWRMFKGVGQNATKRH